MKKSHVQGAIISAGIAWLIGILSGLLSGNQGAVYQSIQLPPYSPPPWLFGVVWPILYILMGIGAYIIYISSASNQDKNIALITYALQLLVNFSWSIVFFRFQEFGWAVVVLALLMFLVALTLTFFYKINKIAAILIIPYFIWLLIAYYLNVGVFVLNP
ncbi:MAG: TspO protein [Anaerocolumna sp.]|jgi:tryptophan-rich sensory protein|nr:TspO protein [Anaerocolumna sp.]